MSLISANKTNANASTEELLAVDVTDIIWHLGEPTEAPLITLTGGSLYFQGENKPQNVPSKVKRIVAEEVSYKVIEKDPLARTVTVNGAVADTTTTTVTLDSNAALKIGDTLKNTAQADGEFFFVYAVDSGGADISVRRNIGSTTFTVADNDTLEIVGYAATDGGAKASIRAQLAEPRTRRTQIFKRTFGVTDTLKNVKLETKDVNAWDEEKTQALVEHKKDIEFSFWFNPGADSSTDADSNTVNLTRGIFAELAGDSTIDAGGGVTEEDFFGAISEQIFQYGPTKKAFFVDSRLKSKMGDWSRVKQQTKPKESVYGINIITLETNHGILDVMTNGAFNKFLPDIQKGIGVAIDLDRIAYKFIANRDSKYEDMIQTPGQDAREAQYITECGLSVRSLLHHKVVKNII